MMLAQFRNTKKGYAVTIVIILLVIGTGLLIMLNRESEFFAKVAGFFSRSKKIQGQAEAGIDLAKGDIQKLALNSRRINTTGLDTFTSIGGGAQDAFDKGLYVDHLGTGLSRTTKPRIERTSNDIELKVFYFPENPCLDITCVDNSAYNKKLPKRFLIVSQATNTGTGEVFTVESRIQVRLENFSEIAFGVLGKGPYPNNPSNYNYAPAVYGRSHWDLPPNKLNFIFGYTGPLEARKELHFFSDLATFQNNPSSGDYPFQRETHSVTQWGDDDLLYVISGLSKQPMINFKKGFKPGVELYNNDTSDPDYIPEYDPSSDTYFNQLKAMAVATGQDLSSALPCPSGGKPIDLCLKFDGTSIKHYSCNYIDANNRIMGRVDRNIHPKLPTQLSPALPAVRWYGDPGDDSGPPVKRFDSSTVTELLDTDNPAVPGTKLYDRYVGERAEVYDNVPPTLISTYPTNGVIFCKPGSCECNIHFKGIVDGKVMLAADYATIEGDTVYANQHRTESNDTLGIVAKKDIIIPPGIPQAAGTAGHLATHHQEPRTLQGADNTTPIGDGTPGGRPETLAESYLGITNFIARSGGSYVDRDFGDEDYIEYANWIPQISLGDTDGDGQVNTAVNPNDDKFYNSPMVLDIDGFMYAGNSLKVDGIWNPQDIGDSTNTKGVGVLTCENPPTCTSYKYRDPKLEDGSSHALYDVRGNLMLAPSMDINVKPLFWNDGMELENMTIGGCVDQSPQNCSNNGTLKTDAVHFRNATYDRGEEVARPLNHLLKVFGGINSKFSFIYDTVGNYKNGFSRKIIEPDPRASYLFPPGYPSTLNVRLDELYQKAYNGSSPMISNN
jgi:hypothetical protein